MLALGKDASKLALLACGRGRAGGHARLGEARRGSSSSRPATSQHGSSRSTGACPACSRHSVQPRQGVWEGRQGQSGPSRARWRAECYHDYELSIGSPAAGLRGALLDGRLLSNLSTVSFTSLLSLQPPAGAGAGRLASPALPTPTTRASARRPRSLRRARGARRSSGACSAGCAAQPDSLRAPLMRRGAAGGAAAAHAALWASPSCPRQVADATCGSRLPCPSLPSRKHTHTHTCTHTHTHY